MSVFNNFVFNKKCPICLEKTEEMFTLDCLHKIHLDCCLNLNSFQCPLCRHQINNFPETIKEAIEKNIIKYKEDLEREDRDNILRTINENYSSIISNLPTISTPQLEIVYALSYLVDNGIPLRYIPEVVSVTLYSNQPKPQPGFFFGVVVDAIIKKITEGIFEENEEDEENEEEDDEEDPFLEENILYEDVKRNVRVRTL